MVQQSPIVRSSTGKKLKYLHISHDQNLHQKKTYINKIINLDETTSCLLALCHIVSKVSRVSNVNKHEAGVEVEIAVNGRNCEALDL